MNEKILNLYVSDTTKSMPLYISGIVPSVYVNGAITTACFVARFDNSTTLDYVYENSLANLVPNPGFETYTTASIVQNWIIDYPDVMITGSATNIPIYYYDGKSSAVAKLQVETTGSLSSGSFAVTAGNEYMTSMQVLSNNGYFIESIPDTLTLRQTTMPATYTAYVRWYTSGDSYLSQTEIMNSSGTTSGIPTIPYYPVCTTRICPTFPVAIIEGEWFKFQNKVTAPATAAKGRIYIEVSTVPVDTSNLYSSSDGGEAFTYIDNVICGLYKTSLLTMFPRADIVITDNFWCVTPEVATTPYTLVFSTSATSLMDSSGRADNTFSAVDTKLTIGRDGVNYWKAWIPFDIDFSALAKGAHINSASLVVVSSGTNAYDSSKTCAVNVGFESTSNLTQPVDWSTLNSKISNEGALTKTITETWSEGNSYNFDITSSAKYLFKAPRGDGTYVPEGEGISWLGSASAAILIKDASSSTEQYRTIVSDEGSSEPITLPAKIYLNYSYNNYTQQGRGTNIKSPSALSNLVYYNSPNLYIGATSGSNRGLLYFDLSSIPASSTITSGCLSLYHASVNSTGTGTLSVYKMLKEWDLYTATWNRQFGTKVWDGGAGCVAGTDYNGTSVGNLSVGPSDSLGYKDITLTTSLMSGWLSSPSTNYGVILKTQAENNDLHNFSSSASLVNKPYMTIYYTYLGTPYTKILKAPDGVTGTITGTEHAIISQYDSYIYDGDESGNYGAETVLRIKGYLIAHTLIKFNLEGVPTSTLSTDGNYIKLYCSSYNGATTYFTVHRILKSWQEGSGVPIIVNGDTIGDVGVTWRYRNYPNATYEGNWAAEGMKLGEDYSSTQMGAGSVSGTGFITINLTNSAEIKNMITANYGVVLRYSGGGTESNWFYSRTGANPPYLYLRY